MASNDSGLLFRRGKVLSSLLGNDKLRGTTLFPLSKVTRTVHLRLAYVNTFIY